MSGRARGRARGRAQGAAGEGGAPAPKPGDTAAAMRTPSQAQVRF